MRNKQNQQCEHGLKKIETSQCHAAEESGTVLDEARATPAAFELLN
jgi:hypothetical protein